MGTQRFHQAVGAENLEAYATLIKLGSLRFDLVLQADVVQRCLHGENEDVGLGYPRSSEKRLDGRAKVGDRVTLVALGLPDLIATSREPGEEIYALLRLA